MSTTQEPEKEEIKVFISHRDSTCDECHEDLGTNSVVFEDFQLGFQFE